MWLPVRKKASASQSCIACTICLTTQQSATRFAVAYGRHKEMYVVAAPVRHYAFNDANHQEPQIFQHAGLCIMTAYLAPILHLLHNLTPAKHI